jgi:hypothetical protein
MNKVHLPAWESCQHRPYVIHKKTLATIILLYGIYSINYFITDIAVFDTSRINDVPKGQVINVLK